MKRTIGWLTVALLTLTACVGGQRTDGTAETSPVLTHRDSLAQRTLTLAFTGDVMMGTLYPRERLPQDSARHIFDHVAPLLRSADAAFGNLEGVMAYSGRNRKNPASKMAFMFMMPPHFAPRLTEAGYDFMCLANNHIYDFWDDGIVSTEQTLDAIGMGYAGAKDPTGKREHRQWDIKEINGVRYGFCAFCHEDYTLRLQDTATVRAIITHLDSVADIVVVAFHGGCEGWSARHLPDKTEYFQGDDRGHLREFARRCVDWGADVVYGHGPHVCRAMQLYKGRIIAYSLGNFCTTGMGVAGVTGYAPLLMLTLDGNGRFVEGKIHSFQQAPMRGPQPDPKNTAAQEIATLTREDIPDSGLRFSPDGTLSPAN